MQAEYRTVSAPVTLIVPAQVDTTTPLTLFATVEEVYGSIAGSAVSREVVHLLLEATRDSGAVVVLYRHDNETTARRTITRRRARNDSRRGGDPAAPPR